MNVYNFRKSKQHMIKKADKHRKEYPFWLNSNIFPLQQKKTTHS